MTDQQAPTAKTDVKTSTKNPKTSFKAQGQRNGNRRDNRRNGKPVREVKKYEEIVINIDRVTRVVKGGRRFRFKALVAIGDGKTKVGVGVAKGGDVQAAVAKAAAVAEKNLIIVPIENDTIAHEIETKVTGAHVLLKPAAPGTGIIAGGVVRSIIGLTSIKNLLSKSLGSTNKVNIAYATIEALRQVVPKEQWHQNQTSAKKSTKTTKKAEEK